MSHLVRVSNFLLPLAVFPILVRNCAVDLAQCKSLQLCAQKRQRPSGHSFMTRPFTFGIAILIAGATQVAAQSVPSLKVEQGCRQVSTGSDKLTTFDQCMADENAARADLIINWQGFLPSDRRVCLAETMSDGTPSYVELLECLNMASDSRRKTEGGRPRIN